jgi:kynurenine formamidase
MCLPDCVVQLAQSRRNFLRAAAATVLAAPVVARAEQPGTQVGAPHATGSPLTDRRIVDLTHALTPDFPAPFHNPLELERISTLGKDPWNINRWHLIEHVGTHIDAPFHCTDLDTVDRIPADQLVGPLAIIDIRDRAGKNPDTSLTMDDLKSWEQKNGRLPEGAIVAMNSGWDAYVHDAKKFLGLDDHHRHHLPGFHVEAVQFLHEERSVKGIAVDTINLDPASVATFPVHHYWLGQNKWGLESLANLGDLPPVGATLVVGAPKIAGATGGPARVLAFV